MCEFKPGDEVVCVDAAAYHEGGYVFPNGQTCLGSTQLVRGKTYTVLRVGLTVTGEPGLDVGMDCAGGFNLASRFRKVQRKTTDLSIESFLTIKDGFEEPRRTPAPARKREEA